LLDVGGKRRLAIEANREVLLAGLQVVDMPGIDDLNIINEAKRRNRNSDDNLFGPTDF